MLRIRNGFNYRVAPRTLKSWGKAKKSFVAPNCPVSVGTASFHAHSFYAKPISSGFEPVRSRPNSIKCRVLFRSWQFPRHHGPQFTGAGARSSPHRARKRTWRFEAQVDRKDFNRHSRLHREKALHSVHQDSFTIAPEISASRQPHGLLDGSLADAQALRKLFQRLPRICL